MSSWIRIEYTVRTETIVDDRFASGSVVLGSFDDTYGLTGERLQYNGEDIQIPWLKLSPSIDFGSSLTYASSTDTFGYVLTSALMRGSTTPVNMDSTLFTGYYIDAEVAEVHDAATFRPPLDDVHQLSTLAVDASAPRELLSATNPLGGQFSPGRLQINGDPITGLPLGEFRTFSTVPSDIWILFDEAYEGQDDYRGFPERIGFTSGDDVIDFGEISRSTGTAMWTGGFRNGFGGDDHVILPTADEAKQIRDIYYSPGVAVQFIRLEVLGHEAFFGGGGNDTVDASGSVTTPWYLYGEQGDDELIGGSTKDALFLGSGNNTLTGGGGADLFKGVSIDFDRAESISTTYLGTDTITDFDPNEDKIDLGDWDADFLLSGNQHFLLRGGMFSGARGEIQQLLGDPNENGRYDITLQIDTTGSKTANHIIVVEDQISALSAENFVGVDGPERIEIMIRPKTGTFFAFAEDDTVRQTVHITVSENVTEPIEILPYVEESELASDLEVTLPLRIPAGTLAGTELTFQLARAVNDNASGNFENGIEVGHLSFALQNTQTADGIPIEITNGEMIPFQIEDGLLGPEAEPGIEQGKLTWDTFFAEMKSAFSSTTKVIKTIDPQLAKELYLKPVAIALTVIDSAFDGAEIGSTLALAHGNADRRFAASDRSEAAKIIYANDRYDAWRQATVDTVDAFAKVGFAIGKAEVVAGLMTRAAAASSVGALPAATGFTLAALYIGTAPALSYDATIRDFIRNAAGAAFDLGLPRAAYVQDFILDPALDAVDAPDGTPLDIEGQPTEIELPDQSINLRGTAEWFDGRTVRNFTEDDRITIEGATFGLSDIAVTYGSAILDIDSDGDRVADTRITLEGDYAGMGFAVSALNGDTVITMLTGSPEATDGADTLIGTEGSDVINALAGNDLLISGGGPDVLRSGSGSDTLFGGAGNDTLIAEAQDNAFDPASAQIVRIYQATLARWPDTAGHLSWTEQVLEGTPLLKVISGFTGSREFQNRYGDTTNEGFVALLYENVLARAPDVAGFANWLERLESGTSREEVVFGFSESHEFKLKTTAETLSFSEAGYQAGWSDDVFRLYQATLDRLPDAPGLEGWAERLAGGADFLETVSGFIRSKEFQNTYGTLEDHAFVTLLYKNVLNREPDLPGFYGWTGLIVDGRSREEVVVGFSQSREFAFAIEPELVAWMGNLTPDDYLDGGSGDDVLFGGIFADTFRFTFKDGGQDVVSDFEAWDTLELAGFGFATATAAATAFVQDGSDAVLDYANGQIRLLELRIDELSADNFVLL